MLPPVRHRAHDPIRLLRLAASVVRARLLRGRRVRARAPGVAGLFWRLRVPAAAAPCARTSSASRPDRTPSERERLARQTFDTFAESLVDAWRAGSVPTERAARQDRRADRLARRRSGQRRAPVERAPRQLGAGRRGARARAGFDVAALARAHPRRGRRAVLRRAPRAPHGVRVVARCPGAREARRVCARTACSRCSATAASASGDARCRSFGTPRARCRPRRSRWPGAPARRSCPASSSARRPGRYRVHVEPPLSTTRASAALERARAPCSSATCARIPEQWFVFEPLWDETA